ncbi:serine acetyltransferase [Klebsiella pneumoniae subsp. ozaenae]|uniref:Serine acetyltransferase n=1 Tax=Klebsiella pneumoniae subsp. ozaenae TaxID=574 RepID=A0A378AV10_KLEPO|nr:serine acetyltransferase [Klebsiella pneumoniae subsp. ozaenae]
MLANKLASPIMPAIAIREVVEEAYAADPEMIASAACRYSGGAHARPGGG